jgi:threonine dehydrogenase-like Zn-dependent dehydrogenase
MGRMHVQHAIQSADCPSLIVCSDVSNERLASLENTFGKDARGKGIDWLCVNPTEKDEYETAMQRFRSTGFDDIVMLAPIPAVIAESSKWLAPRGVMNIFAGITRGTTALLDLNDVKFRDFRFIGHSASVIEDMLIVLDKIESGDLSTNRSVAAVGSLDAAKDGLKAIIDAAYPGKTVIFPHINFLPLTSIADLKGVAPKAYAKLKDGLEWTKEAEKAFLETMLE